MASNDVTTLLIQKIIGQDARVTQNFNFNSSLLEDANYYVSVASSYAQILGTAAGPAAQALAIAYVEATVAEGVGSAAGQAALITAGAAAAGIGAGVVLLMALVLAGLALSQSSGSAQSQEEKQLEQAIQQLAQDDRNAGLGTYWDGKFGPLIDIWDNATGGLGGYLDNLANEGIGPKAVYVHDDAPNYHTAAQNFVIALLPTADPFGSIFWERPLLANETFSAQDVDYYYVPALLGGGRCR
jgi:type II secretory pathway pseudopilin PulG